MSIEYLNKEIQVLKGSPQNILFEGATPQELDQTERALGKGLPQSYKFFLQATNGACFYQTEIIMGTKDGTEGEAAIYQESLVRVRDEMNTKLGLPEFLIPFYEDGRYLFFDTRDIQNTDEGLQTDEYPIVSWDQQTKNITLVSQSFPEWLGKSILNEFDSTDF